MYYAFISGIYPVDGSVISSELLKPGLTFDNDTEDLKASQSDKNIAKTTNGRNEDDITRQVEPLMP